MVPWTHPSPHRKWYLDLFSRFSTTHGYVQQTDTQTYYGTSLPRTSQTTVAFCRTLVVADCGPTPMTCGSCSCREYITNSVIGVSRPPVLDCGTTFHLDYGGGTYLRLLRQSLKTHLFVDRGAYWLFWMYRRYINKFIYLSLSMRCGLIITVSLHHSPKTGSVERWRTMNVHCSESVAVIAAPDVNGFGRNAEYKWGTEAGYYTENLRENCSRRC